MFNAAELYLMLDGLVNDGRGSLQRVKVVDRNGKPFTGVHIDHKKGHVVLVQPDPKVETRTDL